MRFLEQKGNKKAGLLFSLMIILFVASSLVVSLVLTILKVEENLFSALSTIAILLSVTLCAIFSEDKKALISLVDKKFNPLYLILPFLISFSMIFGLGFTNSLIETFFNNLGVTTSSAEINVSSVGQYILFTVFLALIPAVFEEIFFRGVLINNLRTSKLNKILISALCFSVYHGSITKLVYQFIYGVVLALIYVKTENLILTIITHFLNNFIILTVTYFNISVNLFSPVFIIAGTLVLALSVFILIKNQKLTKKEDGCESVKEFFYPYSLMGFCACFVMIIGGLFL